MISLLAAVGVASSVAEWRRAGPERALIALGCACLVLSFGRTSFGDLAGLVPGHADVFFRRFLMGGQLAGIYLAGLGGARAVTWGRRVAAASVAWLTARRLSWLTWAPTTLLTLIAVGYLVPAWRYLDGYDAANAAGISTQRIAQRDDASQLAAVAAVIRRHGGGRAYAGSPVGWGQQFTIGNVPMYQYLDSLDIDEVGYTLRTASLMSQPENEFDDTNAGDYPMLGIRYLIVPPSEPTSSFPLPEGAILLLRNRLARVYELPADSYFQVADTTGTITADRADLGSQTLPFIRSVLPGEGRYLTIAYAGARAARPSLPAGLRVTRSAGKVLSARVQLAHGTASARVQLRRPAIVVLSASYDPGWSVTVDGRPAVTQMVAPALVGVAVPAGTHHVRFHYTGAESYPELLALALLALLVAAALGRRSPQLSRHAPIEAASVRRENMRPARSPQS